jgi:hypothetical protein
MATCLGHNKLHKRCWKGGRAAMYERFGFTLREKRQDNRPQPRRKRAPRAQDALNGSTSCRGEYSTSRDLSALRCQHFDQRLALESQDVKIVDENGYAGVHFFDTSAERVKHGSPGIAPVAMDEPR